MANQKWSGVSVCGYGEHMDFISKRRTAMERHTARARARILRHSIGVTALLAIAAQPVFSQSPPPQNPPLRISPSGKVSIGGSGVEPIAPLDIAAPPRTTEYGGIHPTTVQGLYVTGNATSNVPTTDAQRFVEFRHTNGTQGIGFTFDTIYATGSTSNQRLRLQPRGNASVEVQGPLSVTGRITGLGAVPVGAIMMWSGDVTKLPPGWALCDGNNGTPDLKGRFIVGYDPNKYPMREEGGNKNLEDFRLPEHAHLIGGEYIDFNYDVIYANRKSARMNAPQYTGGVTSSVPIEMRPPYYVLAYIIYRGT
jgi:hypothetical protein